MLTVTPRVTGMTQPGKSQVGKGRDWTKVHCSPWGHLTTQPTRQYHAGKPTYCLKGRASNLEKERKQALWTWGLYTPSPNMSFMLILHHYPDASPHQELSTISLVNVFPTYTKPPFPHSYHSPPCLKFGGSLPFFSMWFFFVLFCFVVFFFNSNLFMFHVHR